MHPVAELQHIYSPLMWKLLGINDVFLTYLLHFRNVFVSILIHFSANVYLL